MLIFAVSSSDERGTGSTRVANGTEQQDLPSEANVADQLVTRSTVPQATYTSQPTYTPLPRYTNQPTYTPLPAAKSRATSTRLPTSTARPTSTLRPTSSPGPTNTATIVLLPTATLLPPTVVVPLPTPTTFGQETAIVTSVIDGDTIEVQMNGGAWRVRYIGIDTPESNDTCGTEATQANAALVAGQTIRMVRDVSETDQYGRLLRYVYVGDTFNGALVAGGWAIAKEYPPYTAMAGLLASLAAQGVGRGCALIAAPLPTAPIRGPGPPAGNNCDPSYPTVCIPPPPPDLDCGDIPHRRFQVLPPDPHNFDGNDNDGIGCEGG